MFVLHNPEAVAFNDQLRYGVRMEGEKQAG